MKRFGADGTLDLQHVVVVLPGARAGRRLVELLVAGCDTLLPPEILSPATLADRLADRLAGPCPASASAMERQLAWCQALARLTPDQRALLTRSSDGGTPRMRLDLARELDELHETLAADGLRIPDAARTLTRAVADFADADRWDVLARLHGHYLRVLKKAERIDPHEHRFKAREATTASAHGSGFETLILVGCADLNAITAQLIRKAIPSLNVVALVAAPPSEAAGFDDLGVLVPSAWVERVLPLTDEQIRFADRPEDEEGLVLSLAGAEPAIRPDDVTIGFGDESAAERIARAFDLADVPTHSALGTSLARTRVGQLIAALEAWVSEGRPDQVDTLVRQPDVERLIDARLKERFPGHARRASWLAARDNAMGALGDREPRNERAALRANEEAEINAASLELIERLRRPLAKERRLAAWTQPLLDLLGFLYGDRTLNTSEPVDAAIARGLLVLRDAVSVWKTLPASLDTASWPATEALHLLRQELAAVALPDPGGNVAVELLGWLELAFDDAPRLILTGANEGHLPQAVNAHAFLPNRARQILGIADNDRRYARDAWLLATTTSRRDATLTVIALRRAADESPLVPSRLLLAADEETLARRIRTFSLRSPGPAPRIRLAHAAVARWRLPVVRPLQEPFSSLSVTAFRDYLACPYRFYLKRVLGLKKPGDRGLDLEAAPVGEILHRILQEFGEGPLRASRDKSEIREYLRDRVEACRKSVGSLEPAAALQLDLLAHRLEAFAGWQAESAREGWAIRFCEKSLAVAFPVDKRPFSLTGTIDRIDYRESDGAWRIIDYKTGDTAKTPDKNHRQGPKNAKTWIDLQLPLYTLLAAQLGVREDALLGYVTLARQGADVKFQDSRWPEAVRREAIEVARGVVRGILDEVFWPPRDPEELAYDDDLSALLLDDYVGRADAIAQGTAANEAARAAGTRAGAGAIDGGRPAEAP